MNDVLTALLAELADALDWHAEAFYRHGEFSRCMHCKALADKARVAVAGGVVMPYE